MAHQIDSLRNSLAQTGGLPFADLLPAQRLHQFAQRASGALEPVYTPLVTLWMFLSQVLDADHSCRQVVARLLAW
jgi:hypothetical protein